MANVTASRLSIDDGTITWDDMSVDGTLTVGNLTITTSEIDVSSGDLTIDVEGSDILLSAAYITPNDGYGMRWSSDVYIYGSSANAAEYVRMDLPAKSGAFYIDRTGKVGIGSTAPFQNVAGGSLDLSVDGAHIKGSSHAQLLIEGSPPSLNMIDTGGGSNDKWMLYRVDGGIGYFISINDSGSTVSDNILVMDLGTGAVGIGMSNPTDKLKVTGNIQLTRSGSQFIGTSATGAAIAINSTGGAQVEFEASGSDDKLHLVTHTSGASHARRLTVDAAGNVGIGTTSPEFGAADLELTLHNASANAPALNIGNVSTADGHYAGTINFHTTNNTSSTANKFVSRIQAELEGSTSANRGGHLKLFTKPDNGALAERMRIDATGNVGIGTTTPYNLSNYTFLTMHHATNGGGMIMQDGSQRRGAIYNGDADVYLDGQTNLFFRTGSEPPAGTKRMTVNATGIGMGTAYIGTTPVYPLNIYKASADRTSVADVLALQTAGTGGTGYDGIGTAIIAYGRTYQSSGSHVLARISFTEAGNSGNDWGYDIGFETKVLNAGSTAPTEKMIIRYDGKVGIGTATPEGKLDVGVPDASGMVNALVIGTTSASGSSEQKTRLAVNTGATDNRLHNWSMNWDTTGTPAKDDTGMGAFNVYISPETSDTHADSGWNFQTMLAGETSFVDAFQIRQDRGVFFYGATSGQDMYWSRTSSNGCLVLNDNTKAKFGSGGDLEIYHDGSNSYIGEVGTGNLFIQSPGVIKLRSSSGAQGINMIPDAAVELYHNNSLKLITQTTGIESSGSNLDVHLRLKSTGTNSYPTIRFQNDTNTWRLYGVNGAHNNSVNWYDETGSIWVWTLTAGASGNMILGNYTATAAWSTTYKAFELGSQTNVIHGSNGGDGGAWIGLTNNAYINTSNVWKGTYSSYGHANIYLYNGNIYFRVDQAVGADADISWQLPFQMSSLGLSMGGFPLYDAGHGNNYWTSSALYTTGTIYATSTITQNSDVRLKENIVQINSALEKVNQMRGVTYDRIDTGESGVGVIAQELELIAPELIHIAESKNFDKKDSEEWDDYKSVAYGNLTAYLIEAVKELTEKVDDLERKLGG